MSATVTKITPPPPTVLPDVQLVAIEQLYASRDNPRSDLGDLEELTASIREMGLLQPIRVVTNTEGGGFIIVSGHRRHAAALAASAVEVPVLIEALEEEDRVTVQLVENLHRLDLSPLEKATGFQQLFELGNSQGSIAKLVGVSQGTVSQGTVSKHLSLLRLPEKGRELIESGRIAQEEGVVLAGLPEPARDKVLTAPGDQPSYWIERGRGEEQRRVAIAAELATLEKAGVPVIEFGDVKRNGDVGPMHLSSLHWVKPSAHKKADCRAVGVREDGSALIELCTTPKNHPKPKSTGERMGRAEPKLSKQQEEATAERERLTVLLNEANERRQKWLVSLDGPATGLLAAVVALNLLDRRGYEQVPDRVTVMDWLGLDHEGLDPDAMAADLVLHPKSDRERLRLIFLLAVSSIEEDDFYCEPSTIYRSEFAGDEHVTQTYLELLVTLGYELSWIEQMWAGLPFEEPVIEAEAEAEKPEPSHAASDFHATPIPEPAPDVLPEIYVQQKGKRWMRRCSICGPLTGFNTNEETATDRGALHLADEHGIEVVA